MDASFCAAVAHDRMILPTWSTTLRQLYWQLRMHRPGRRSSPSRSTQYRRIRAEKLRLHELGVPIIEIHLVSRVLCNPNNPRYRVMNMTYLERRATGQSVWHTSRSKTR